MENEVEWHGGVVTSPLYDKAMAELAPRLAALEEFALVEIPR